MKTKKVKKIVRAADAAMEMAHRRNTMLRQKNGELYDMILEARPYVLAFSLSKRKAEELFEKMAEV